MAEPASVEAIRDRFLEFLEYPHEQDDEGNAVSPYLTQLLLMPEANKTTLYVDFADLNNYDVDLADLIKEHHYRLDPCLKKALQNCVQRHMPDYVTEEGSDKEFWVSFYNMPLVERMRDLKAGKLGRLVSFTGTVTRTSEIRPELYLGTFKCQECGQLVHNVEQQFKFTQPLICSNDTCGNRRSWELVREESAFVDWQRAKVQETSEEVPPGSLPRTTEVILRHDIVECARAGDKMTFTGNVIVVPDVGAISTPGERVEASMSRGNPNGTAAEGVGGLRYLGVRELTYKLAFLASSVMMSDRKLGMVNIRGDEDVPPEQLWSSMPEGEKEEINAMKCNPRLYEELATSLAPGVFGAMDVKRSVLLMLLGGVHKDTSEGISLRGDINVAIIGDPSCAKSQILKYVSSFLPRAVYTSGKSSSAAGLTASVVKEPDSNEFCIEAGALMLADNGICCIDEFDKMDYKDQVAIHEAMEQQTISIAKAGIQATLNARTSILAAANPRGGRYDRSQPLRHNVDLPPALLSRFDLLNIMIDEVDDVADKEIAKHIIAVHQKRDQSFAAKYNMTQIQRYIKFARSLKPQMTQESKRTLVEGYKRLRSEDAVPGSSTSYRITVRQLEALVRLSEALARLRCTDTIVPQYVREALRLVKESIIQVQSPETEVDDIDFVDDLGEVEDVVARFRRAEQEGAAGNAATAAEQQPPLNGGQPEDAAPVPMDVDGTQQAAARDGGAPPAAGQAAAQPNAQRQAEPSAEELAQLRAGAVAGVADLQQSRRQPTKVSQSKVDRVKNLLITRLRELEVSGQASGALVGDVEVASMTQHDLVTWYFDYQTSRQAFSSAEELEGEVSLVSKIVQHLIRREAVLVVVETPQRNEGEALADFNKRQQRERYLAINPNYSFE